MKKALALILAVVMCIGMASVAFGIDVTLPLSGCVIVDNNGNAVIDAYLDEADGTICYVAGSEFYIIPDCYLPGEEEHGNYDNFEITKAEVKQGSTTVYEPAFFFDDEGAPQLGWVIQMKTKDIAAVKEYDTILHIEGKWFDRNNVEYKVSGDLRLVVKDTDMIDENDINKARIDDADVITTGAENGGYRYVVSADAFKAIKSGETFKFPYDGYTLTVGSGIKNALNFRASVEKIDAIVEKYGADKVLGVIDFKDKNDLPVEIGVDMECTEYSSTHKTNVAYVYRVEGDKLVLVTDKATYDAARETVSFKTNKLGTLVISAEPLTDAKAETETKKNPTTGANDVVGLAVAGAVVAMAAGFVALKK
ncbi:hypothetical protein [Zongyangia hominis]|uniref:Gram-positive cocci surface proteins LPxTG domain-containing protein n=1 Tax=Zongyangia hominis TaxID=2763677 RepID=A0A926I7B0_9FIRM|nr:hypothetical protein [Zongyangia hominis]MBC8570899.1 hypothetical protein [Zongyangia hominis]